MRLLRAEIGCLKPPRFISLQQVGMNRMEIKTLEVFTQMYVVWYEMPKKHLGLAVY